MQLVTTADEYLAERSRLETQLILDRKLPNQVFQTNFAYYRFLDFDQLMTGRLLMQLRRFFCRINEFECVFSMIEPDPVEYFNQNFGAYPVIKINPFCPEEDFYSLLHQDPGDSPADALAYLCQIVCMYGGSDKWMLYADRDLELAVVGLVGKQEAFELDKAFEHRTYSTDLIFPELLAPVFSGQENIPSEIVAGLRDNYLAG